MDNADWIERWQAGQIGFHQAEVNDFLRTHADRAWPKRLDRVLVPLCGKSLDMVFLAERAERVVGVELAEKAATEFFAERSLEPTREVEPMLRYHHAPYDFVVGDFFDVRAERIGSCDGAFDRAALVALPPDIRPKYAAHLASLLAERARLLLVTFDYDPSEMDGPPFAVTDDEVQRLFADGFEIERLDSRDALADAPKFRERGVTEMRESAFVLTKRAG